MSTRGQKYLSSAHNYKWNLERKSNSSKSTRTTGWVLWEELLKEVILHITPLSSILHRLLKDKTLVHVFAGRVKIVSHSSCRTSTILKNVCPLSTKPHVLAHLMAWVMNPFHSYGLFNTYGYDKYGIVHFVFWRIGQNFYKMVHFCLDFYHSKQCIPWWNATLCSISSGSSLFAKKPAY